jgi:quercetin dioxygenase-like cupin family protein
MEAKGFVVPPGQGRVWEMAAGRSSALKLLGGETGDSVMMFEETAPSGTETTYHRHHDSDEVAYVLAGEITFKIGDEITVGGPGTCAFMPRGLAHAWKNSAAETARVLFLYTPAGAGGFFEESQRLRRSYESFASEDVRAAYRRHRWEIVGPPPFDDTRPLAAFDRETGGRPSLEPLADVAGADVYPASVRVYSHYHEKARRQL